MTGDMFGRAPPTIEELMDRIEALEAIVFQKAKPERVQVDEPLNEAWQKWNRYRNGKGWTAEAKKLSMNKLRELAGTDGALALNIVEQSVERGWTGLFPLKSSETSRAGSAVAGSTQQTKYKTAAETLIPTESREDNDAAWRAQQRALGLMP